MKGVFKIAQEAHIKISAKLDPKNTLKADLDKLIKQVQNNKIKISIDTKSLEKAITSTQKLSNNFKTMKFGNGNINGEIEKTRASIERLGGTVNSVTKTTSNTGRIASATIQWTDSTNKLQTSYYKLNSTIQEVNGQMVKVESWGKSSQKQVDGISKLNAEYDKLQKKLIAMQTSYNKNLSNTGMRENVDLIGRYTALQSQLNSLKQQGSSADTKELNNLKQMISDTERLTKENQELNNVQKQIVALQKKYDNNVKSTGASKDVQVAKELASVLEKINSLKAKGTALTQKEQSELRENVQHASKLTQEAMETNNAFKRSNASIKSNSNALRQQRTLTSQMASDMRSYMGTWISVTALITTGVMQIKKAITATIEMNSAMTEVKMITNESAEAYAKLGENATDMAIKTGKSSEEAIRATRNWIKAGEDMQNAQLMAETTLMGSVLAETDVDNMQRYLVAPMKAWNVEAEDSMQILDKMNYGANQYAVSLQDVGESYSRASSVAKLYGNSLEQVGAMTLIAQDQTQLGGEVIGTAIRSISQRLGAMKDDDGNVIPKLEEDLKSLAGVDMRDVNGEMRSTYDVIEDLASVYPTLTKEVQAYLLELTAGKRSSAIMASLLDNFDEVNKAKNMMETEALGSSEKMMNEYKKSLEYQANELKENVKLMYRTLIPDTELSGMFSSFNGFITGVTGIIGSSVSKFGTVKTVILGVASASILLSKNMRTMATSFGGNLIGSITKCSGSLTYLSKVSRASNIATHSKIASNNKLIISNNKQIAQNQILGVSSSKLVAHNSKLAMSNTLLTAKIKLTTMASSACKLALGAMSMMAGMLAVTMGVTLISNIINADKKLREFNENTIASMNESTEKIKQNTDDIKSVEKVYAEIDELQGKINKSSNAEERNQLEQEMISKKQALIDLMPDVTDGMNAETTSQLELNKALDIYIKAKERENELETRKQRNEARKFISENDLNSGKKAGGVLNSTLYAESNLKFLQNEMDKLDKLDEDSKIKLDTGSSTTVKKHREVMQSRLNDTQEAFEKENTLLQQTYDAYKTLDPANLRADQLDFIKDFEKYQTLLKDTESSMDKTKGYKFDTTSVKSSVEDIKALKDELKDSKGHFDGFSASSKESLETMVKKVDGGKLTVEDFNKALEDFELASKDSYGENAAAAKAGMDKVFSAFSKGELSLDEYSNTMKATTLLSEGSMKAISKSAQKDMATVMNRFNNVQIPIKDLGKTLELTSQMGQVNLDKLSDKSRETVEKLSQSFANGEISIVDFEKIVSSMTEYSMQDFSKLDAKSQETMQSLINKLPEGGQAVVDFENTVNGMSIRSSLNMDFFDKNAQIAMDNITTKFNNTEMTAEDFSTGMSFMSLMSSDAMKNLDGSTQSTLNSLIDKFGVSKTSASEFADGVMSAVGIVGTKVGDFSAAGQTELLSLIDQFMNGSISAEDLNTSVANLKDNPDFYKAVDTGMDKTTKSANEATGAINGVIDAYNSIPTEPKEIKINTTKTETTVKRTINEHTATSGNPQGAGAPVGGQKPNTGSIVDNGSGMPAPMSRNADNKNQVLSSDSALTTPMDTGFTKSPSSNSDGNAPATGGNVEISQNEPKNPNLRDAAEDEKRKQEEAIRERETMESNALREIEELRNKLAQALKKKLEKQRDDELKILDEKLDAIEKSYDEQKKLLDKSTKDKIDALNKEKDALNKDREEDYQATVDALKKEKAMWEQNDSAYAKGKVKELEEKLKEAEKELRNKQIDDEIDAINKAQEEKEKLLEEEKNKKVESLEKQKEDREKYWEQQLSDQNIYNEANKLLLNKNMTEMTELIKEYAPEWDNIGLLFGESLLDGIKRGLTDGLNAKDFMDGIKSSYEQSKPSYESSKKPSGGGSNVSNDSNNSKKNAKVVGVSSSLNVRDGAGTNYKKIGSVWKDEEVEILEEKDGWCKIEYLVDGTNKKKQGWATGNYIQRFHTGGIIGKMTSDEGIAMVQSGERVLSREQTGSFDKLVYEWMPKFNDIMLKFNNLKANDSSLNNNNSVTVNNEWNVENNTPFDVKKTEKNIEQVFKAELRRYGKLKN